MGAKVRVHHPDLSPSERAAREEEIKRALVTFYKEVSKAKKLNEVNYENED
jgi:hypothetical protein